MKKLMSVVLVVVLSLSCLLAPTASAVTVSLNSEAAIYTLLQMLGEGLPDTQQQRVDVFNTLAMYMSTDTNMDNLIMTVENLESYADDLDAGNELEAKLKLIIEKLADRMGGLAALTDEKENIMFILCLLRALPVDSRMDAISDFSDEQERNDQASPDDGPWGDETELSTKRGFQEALESIYSEYVSGEAADKLATHGIGPNTILRLAAAFKDNMMLTNGKQAEFALKSIDGIFEERLNTVFSTYFTEINGVEITNETAADVVMEAFVAIMNDIPAELVDDFKTVLGNKAVKLYTETKSSSSTSDGKGDTAIILPNTTIEPLPSETPGLADHIYPDTVNHWAKDYIKELSYRGIFEGYEDGYFRPDWNITREEIAVVMTRALNLEAKAAYAPQTSFDDNDEISVWAKDAVNLMVEMGIFTGYDDNCYRPKQIITREELTAVLIRKIGVGNTTFLAYKDALDIGDWSKAYVATASAIHLVNGYPDGTFMPRNPVTRAEAAKMLYNFLGHIR